jgi:chemotaxis protein methyltransferase CheR
MMTDVMAASGPRGPQDEPPGSVQEAPPVDPGLDRMRHYLLDRTGVRIPSDQAYFFESRLRRIMTSVSVSTFDQLVGAMQRDTAEARALTDRVVDALMTHETSFFRNPEVFRKLQSALIPEVTARLGPKADLRLWSAAASTGQEAVSLSILMHEMGHQRPYSILGTDIGVATIDKARAGAYSVLETNRGLSGLQLNRWFEREGASFRSVPSVRNPISFRVHNLLEPMAATAPFHVVMLRNVLVYFDEASRMRTFENVARVVAPGGVVVLGTGEQLLNIPEHLFTRHIEERVAWLCRRG